MKSSIWTKIVVITALSSSLIALDSSKDLSYRGENERGNVNRGNMQHSENTNIQHNNIQHNNIQHNNMQEHGSNPYNHGNTGDKAAYRAGYDQGTNNANAGSEPIIIAPDNSNQPPAGVPLGQ